MAIVKNVVGLLVLVGIGVMTVVGFGQLVEEYPDGMPIVVITRATAD